VSTKEPLPPSRGSRAQPASFVKQLALALELPVIPVVAVLLGGGLGYWIDGKVHTKGVFAILLGAVGFAAGIADVIRRASRQEKE
jgi:F0F1-type ATP synthase assembly protein I